MAKTWTMTADHAAHAAKFPCREGYKCGAHAETYGGGCFNCGWNTADGREAAQGLSALGAADMASGCGLFAAIEAGNKANEAAQASR